jgi:PBP1b-binding outer membrane lipoprotein LpoB
MNKKAIVLSLLAAITLSSCSADTSDTAEKKEDAKPQESIALVKSKKPQPVGPWLFTLQKVTTPGQKMKSWLEEKPMEAAGQWAIAHVQIQNISKTRQSLKDVVSLASSKIVDEKGKSKELDTDVTSVEEITTFDEKPLNPGESRTVKLVFDMPTAVSVSRIDIPAAKSSADIKVLPAQ